MKKLDWNVMIKPYQRPDHLKSYWQIGSSLTLFVGSWISAYFLYETSAWLTVLMALAAQFFYLRLFIIMHDCGHGSFFKAKKKRDFWGTLTGIITFTPYHQWTEDHAAHHKHSGNLDHRGRGDIWTMTVAEYQNASKWERYFYHLYRFPPFMLLVGGIYNFGILHRFPTKHDTEKARKSVRVTNIAILCIAATIISLTSVGFYLTFQISLLVFGGLFGIGLFYVQHQFEDAYWRDSKEWNYETAALTGSTYLKLPRVFQWASGNIGFHHIHHLSPMIPNYKLEKVYREQNYFQMDEVTLTMKDLIACFKLHLYDELERKMVGFQRLKYL